MKETPKVQKWLTKHRGEVPLYLLRNWMKFYAWKKKQIRVWTSRDLLRRQFITDHCGFKYRHSIQSEIDVYMRRDPYHKVSHAAWLTELNTREAHCFRFWFSLESAVWEDEDGNRRIRFYIPPYESRMVQMQLRVVRLKFEIPDDIAKLISQFCDAK
jgi:hypothetical protein